MKRITVIGKDHSIISGKRGNLRNRLKKALWITALFVAEGIMSFEEFIEWAENGVRDWQELPTLGRRSRFHTKYDLQRHSMIVRNSKGKEYALGREALLRIFQRYITAPREQIHRANYYTDPIWPETPHRIAAPYIPALLRYWAEGCQ